MATQILASGVGAANSADIVVTTPIAVTLKNYVADSEVYVLMKDDAAAYQKIGSLRADNPSKVISGPGSYRFTRPAISGTCGVFSG